MMQSERRPAILALGTAVPQYCAEQSAIAEWVASAFDRKPAVQRLVRTLYAYSGIETRYSCTPDYLQPVARSRFSPGRPLEETPTTAERMAMYERESTPLGVQAAQEALARHAQKTDRTLTAVTSSITHLIAVSCTGFFAPGLDFVLAQRLGLPPTVQRTLIGFMGCSAAFNGLRAASQIVRADPAARVLMVNVELCSLHSQPGTARDDLVSTSLFADGASACLVGIPQPGERDYFAIGNFHTSMKPETESAMVWQIGNHGFTLRLSPRVPEHLADIAPTALRTLFEAERPGFWAIHPGGRAIVDRLAEIFQLDANQVAASRSILRQYGNLSSATIMFVLQEIVNDLYPSPSSRFVSGNGQYIAHRNGPRHNRAESVPRAMEHGEDISGVAMAFGPGLVIEMAHLTYVPARLALDHSPPSAKHGAAETDIGETTCET